MKNEGKLREKVVMITGAANNIGRKAAVMMVKEGADFSICTLQNKNGLNETARLVGICGSRCFHRLMDLRDEKQVRKFLADTVKNLGRLDCLVNSAAVRRHFAFQEMTLERWGDAHNVILEGAFLCTHAAVPHIKAAGAER